LALSPPGTAILPEGGALSSALRDIFDRYDLPEEALDEVLAAIQGRAER